MQKQEEGEKGDEAYEGMWYSARNPEGHVSVKYCEQLLKSEVWEL